MANWQAAWMFGFIALLLSFPNFWNKFLAAWQLTELILVDRCFCVGPFTCSTTPPPTPTRMPVTRTPVRAGQDATYRSSVGWAFTHPPSFMIIANSSTLMDLAGSEALQNCGIAVWGRAWVSVGQQPPILPRMSSRPSGPGAPCHPSCTNKLSLLYAIDWCLFCTNKIHIYYCPGLFWSFSRRYVYNIEVLL